MALEGALADKSLKMCETYGGIHARILGGMEDAILDIARAVLEGEDTADPHWLEQWLRTLNRARSREGLGALGKRDLLDYYLGVKEDDRPRWEAWHIDAATHAAILRVLRIKPRRSASGVATITVITKPWPCSGACVFCPNDIRMPKSYLANEPACQRAELCCFDPYLQVTSRLRALSHMGHVTSKVELIVLGGTFGDYPSGYQRWFVSELFRALNDFGEPTPAGDTASERAARYVEWGLPCDPETAERATASLAADVMSARLTYNEAVRRMAQAPGAIAAADFQQATQEELEREQRRNESSSARVVGLSVETRPDLVSIASARELRRLGCTKVQMGVQSVRQETLSRNGRNMDVGQIADAFDALRLVGFKVQVHAMANLVGSTPELDAEDYRTLASDPRFMPDEVKIYPCALVESARLTRLYEDGTWQPYTTDELVDLLVADTLATPAHTRISRMIRDISATDIVAGNKTTNLRQMVEAHIADSREQVREIRLREVATSDVDVASLRLDEVSYETRATSERFLQWVDKSMRIAGFLRLSLPREGVVAMIRELHVYGRVAALGEREAGGAQHAGLGRRLVERACELARQEGYGAIDVISAVGTRPYYRELGFCDNDLYQRRVLVQGDPIPDALARRLMDTTSAFYARDHTSFSATRSRPWEGWEQALDACDITSGSHVDLIDLGCGNLRFERWLTTRGVTWRAWAQDVCDELARDAVAELEDVAYQHLDIGRALLEPDGLAGRLDAPPVDLAVCFGLMHHLPLPAQRVRLVRDMVGAVHVGGHVVVSLWQLERDARIRAKARPVPGGGPHDYLLGWQDSARSCRYCHSFQDDEIDRLVQAVGGNTDLVARLQADGPSGNLNCYLVLRRRR